MFKELGTENLGELIYTDEYWIPLNTASGIKFGSKFSVRVKTEQSVTFWWKFSDCSSIIIGIEMVFLVGEVALTHARSIKWGCRPQIN